MSSRAVLSVRVPGCQRRRRPGAASWTNVTPASPPGGGSYHGGMRPAEPLAAAAAVWDIAVPSRPGPVAGVKMAGFRARAKEPADLPVVPYPAVTLVIDLGHGPLLVEDASGQPRRGSLAAGLAPGPVRARRPPNATRRGVCRAGRAVAVDRVPDGVPQRHLGRDLDAHPRGTPLLPGLRMA